MDKLSLYIHIPFCVSKCHYCDFLSSSFEEQMKGIYVEALCKEIRSFFTSKEAGGDSRSLEGGRLLKRDGKYVVDTVFFGGGTPSLLSKQEICEIFSSMEETFCLEEGAEITMEMNPGTVSQEKLQIYKRLGINRLSIGLQSADNRELCSLGRIHTWEDFLESWNKVRENGFDNVNIDLMSAIPGQTLESYEKTLKKVISLSPEHISAYSLIIEEGTPFYEWFSDNGTRKEELPKEDDERKMYYMTEQLLKEKGYERYEISNYAKAGYECRHNEGYWTGKNYLGVGLGASSFINNMRFKNEEDLTVYIKKMGEDITPVIEKQVLETTDRMQEYMFLGLRRMKGISKNIFFQKFGVSMESVYGKEIKKLMEADLLEEREQGETVALTKRGIDVSNMVFLEFI